MIYQKGNTTFILYSCRDGRLKYYTGYRVGSPVLKKVKPLIEHLKASCNIASIPFTKEVLRSKLDELFGKKNTSSKLIDQMKNVTRLMAEGKILTPQKKKYEKGSLKALNYTITVIEKFKPGLTVEKLNLKLEEEFISWCHKKSWSTNYIGGQIKAWKAICKHIPGCGVMKEFKKINEETARVSLSEEEIKSISLVECSGKKELARDWFVIGCYTGLRVSDLKRLQKKNITKEFIVVSNEKTDDTVTIPVHPMVKSIIKKYGGFPPYISDGEINEWIKKLGKDAGINETVLFTNTEGGKRKDYYYKKYELITTHTGRRSFITNLRKSGVPDSVIMKLAGIRSIATLKKYDLLTHGEAGKIASGLEFFN